MLELTQRVGPPRAVVGALLLLLAVVLGCGSSEYRTPLPSGCTLYKIHGTGVFVAGRGDLPIYFVPPDIADFAVVDDRYFVGRLRPPEADDPTVPNQPGFFIADARTGGVRLGLDEATWRSALGEAGIDRDLSVSGIPIRYNTSPVATLARFLFAAALLVVLAVAGLMVLAVLGDRRRRRQKRLGHSEVESGT